MLSPTPVPELERLPASRSAVLERPFYFIIVLWGERFRNYFVDLCVPTLLSPGNLPTLNTRQRSKFFVCTRPQDWAALQVTPAFRALEEYVDPVYLEIPECPPEVSACVHMGIGHRHGCEMAYAAKAYPFVLTPDCIFSDGTLARLQELALRGVEIVLVPALRFAEEPLFEQLEQAGIEAHRRNGSPAPITLKNRDLVRMALASMHSETKTYEWDAPYLYSLPSAVWWRVPEEEGIVVHSFSWAPFLFDFAAVPEHDTSTFDEWTFDGDYIYRNLGDIKRVHLVLDSDEIFIASWGPSSERSHDFSPKPQLARRFLGGYFKRQQFNAAFHSGVFDPFKQQIFFSAARWHAKPLTRKWLAVEHRAGRTLRTCVAPPKKSVVFVQQSFDDALREGDQSLFARSINSFLNRVDLLISPFLFNFFDEMVTLSRRFGEVVTHVWDHREAIIPRIRQLLGGNSEVIAWLKWRLREIAYRLVGRVPDNRPARPSR